jgi:HK97 family phage major capsid protein
MTDRDTSFHRLTNEDINNLRRVVPEAANKLLKEQEHPADIRRQQMYAKEQMRNMLDRAEAEKRPLTNQEQAAWDVMDKLMENADIQLSLLNITNQFVNGTTSETVGVYAKGEKCALNFRQDHLRGITLGNIMRGMAVGTNGNQNLQNALGEGLDSAGGYTAPEEILREFIDKLRAKSVLFNAGARTVFLDAKKTNIATVDTDPTPGWRAENAEVSESDMALGNVAFVPKSLAVLVKVSRELLQDSLNIEEILMNSLAQGIATQLDYAGLYGTGLTNQPTGLSKILTDLGYFTELDVNGATLSLSGNYKPFLNSMATIAGNNDQANAFVMSPRTKYDLGGLVDSLGQPLMPPPLIADNIQILDTSSVPSNIAYGTGTNTSEVFIGNFEHMMLGLRQQLRIEVLSKNFAGNLQVGFLAHLRADWQVSRPSSFTMIKGIKAE